MFLVFLVCLNAVDYRNMSNDPVCAPAKAVCANNCKTYKCNQGCTLRHSCQKIECGPYYCKDLLPAKCHQDGIE